MTYWSRARILERDPNGNNALMIVQIKQKKRIPPGTEMVQIIPPQKTHGDPASHITWSRLAPLVRKFQGPPALRIPPIFRRPLCASTLFQHETETFSSWDMFKPWAQKTSPSWSDQEVLRIC